MNPGTAITDTTDGSRRLATPPLTDLQRAMLERYCEIYHHRLGPGLLLAGMREVRRKLGPEEIAAIEAMLAQANAKANSNANASE